MTLKDISKLTGYSISTISRVINNKNSKCASETAKNKIWQAVRSLGYTPNIHAKNLKNSRNTAPNTSQSIGYYLTHSETFDNNTIYNALIPEIETALFKKGYCAKPLDISSTSFSDKGSGIIVIGKTSSSERAKLHSLYKNIVSITDGIPETTCDYVFCDSYKAVAKAIDYLQGQNHKSIAFIGQTLQTSRGYRAYLDKYIYKTLKQHKNSLSINCKNSSFKSLEIAEKFLSLNPRPTAIICASYSIALFLYKYFAKNNISVPRDVSIIAAENSFKKVDDNIITFVDQGYPTVSHFATSLLIDRIDRKHSIKTSLEVISRIVDCKSVRSI